MLLTPSSRLRVRLLLIVVSLGVALVAFISFAAKRQNAAGAPPRLISNNFAHPAAVIDKGAITPASAITVNSLSDVANGTDGLCTLREGITAAQTDTASGAAAGECAAGSSSGSDAISIGVNGTINLTAVLPDINTDMTITGPGSGLLTVRRSAGFYRIFSITNRTVAISGLTVANGRPPDGLTLGEIGSSGGGILNFATLTLTDVVVTGNTAGNGQQGTTVGGGGGVGGGIVNTGTLTMTNCTVTGNNAGFGGEGSSSGGAGGSGGGIYSTGHLTMTNCSVTNNHARSGGNLNSSNPGGGGTGGGIYSNESPTSSQSLIMTDCLIDGNSTGTGQKGGNGGGIDVQGGTTTLTRVTISNNVAADSLIDGTGGDGGGISSASIDSFSMVTIVDSTIDSNRSGDNPGSSGGPGADGRGGGIYINHHSGLFLARSTVSNNISLGNGGGVFTWGSSRVENTTISGNTGSGGGIFFYQDGSLALTSSTLSNNTNFASARLVWLIQS